MPCRGPTRRMRAPRPRLSPGQPPDGRGVVRSRLPWLRPVPQRAADSVQARPESVGLSGSLPRVFERLPALAHLALSAFDVRPQLGALRPQLLELCAERGRLG